MKNIFIIFALTFSWLMNLSAQKEKLYTLFDKYQETEGVTTIKIAKPMFGMLSKLDLKDAELDHIKPMLDKIQGLRIMVIEKPELDSLHRNISGAMLNFNALQKEISGSLKNMNYEELMTVNSKGNKVKFLAGDATNGILDNLLLSVNSEGSTVLMMLDGKISMDDVNKLANETQSTSMTSFPADRQTSAAKPSAGTVEEIRKVGNFTGISVSSGIKVTFLQGNNRSVKVITDSDKLQYIKTQVQGDILKISLYNPENKNLNFKIIQVRITAPELTRIAVSSGANFTAENTVNSSFFQVATTSGAHINADLNTNGKVELSTASGSSARLGIEAKSLEMSATSGSNASITGTVDDAVFQLSSAATVNAQDLASKTATTTATSASNLKVNVSGRLTASASTGASIKYRNDLKSAPTVSTTSGGTVKSF